jgi:hypothetical protein
MEPWRAHFGAVEGLETSVEHINHLHEDLGQHFKKRLDPDPHQTEKSRIWIRIRLKSRNRIPIKVKVETRSASKRKYLSSV